ncbi:uncharacterized protein, YkwD family [Salinibacillus kushneri]|uniref:Uncharacterized protein, YkwD family n=1 Tax=Salinibacillus kushneri TaxID=237682 RepID=A0A1I0AA89_9BACI|nr:CAP domain-containing protein [Salinibacillus kushneri]SES90175.1 uncharacterized protein, YkwD family [Salinibacillus kushneri]
MFKKIAMLTALSSAVIFGSAFDKADAEQNHSFNHNISYFVNGENGSLMKESQMNINKLMNQLMENYNMNWKEFNQKQDQGEKPAQKEQPVKEPSAKDPSKEQKQEQAQEKAPEQEREQAQEQAKETENSQSQESNLSQFEQEVVDLTNQEREKQGLAPLKIDKELSKVAREKSRDMAENNYFSHNSPNYGSPFNMMKSYGITYRTAGENIAKGQRTPEEVVNGWMNSEGHRANILNENFTHIGVGYVEQGNHWTQQFIGK